MKPEIIPAILAESFDDIAQSVYRVDDLFSRVHIDIVDGVHAPGQTWPYASGETVDAAVQRLHNITLSHDLDLMIDRPEEVLDQWLLSGARRVSVHLSSTRHIKRCLQQVRDAGSEAYVGVVIDDDISTLETVSDHLDGIQCMGIKDIGRQGEPYDRRVLNLMQAVQDLCPGVPVAVDGGVSPKTIPELIEAGASCLAVGSALFRGDVSGNTDAIESAMSVSASR
ncbi:MAG: thiamine phosphate synthase [Candidatus Kaiserbacteria bacterium]|nr:thiamine phosphate synthase [Candidatus Kaiserbacteria bacterium]